MTFDECLNDYINKIGCTSKELSEASSISDATISRYRKGERVPAKSSEIITSIAIALEKIAVRKDIGGVDSDTVADELRSSINEYDFTQTAGKFDLLINSLNINASELSSALNYDPSYISRVRANKRQPYDVEGFISKVSQYTIEHFKDKDSLTKMAQLLKLDESELEDSTNYKRILQEWLMSNAKPEFVSQVNPSSFLNKLDEFNLDEFIESIHFNDIKVTSVPFQMTTHKSYYGLAEMREGELDFFKSTVLSKSNKPVTLCCDMPMEDMSEDPDFISKWVWAIAVCLKKGLHVNIIHTLDRPFSELLMGLEYWIPLYMTGLVNPYYIKEITNSVYGHLHYTSGEVALFGECIESHHDKGHYYLTRKKEEVAMYREYTDFLLEKSLPLMKFYRYEERDEFASFLPTCINCPKGILHNYTSLPIYTLDADELLSILIKNELGERETDYMLQYHRAIRNSIETILKEHPVTDNILAITKENFEEKKPYLLLTETFCSKQIYYTWDLYKKHLKKTEEFAKEHPNYTLIKLNNFRFKNIQITVVRDKWALISKSNNPNIHFVIHHPILRDAIENMIVTNRE